jgi:hypothetical protein
VLAVIFAIARVLPSTQPREKLMSLLTYVEDLSMPAVRLIGVAELSGAVGLDVHAVTGIAPRFDSCRRGPPGWPVAISSGQARWWGARPCMSQ